MHQSDDFEIKFCTQATIKELLPFVELVLEAIDCPEAWVSDYSTLGDFGFVEVGDLPGIAERLGLSTVTLDDFIYAIAFRVKMKDQG